MSDEATLLKAVIQFPHDDEPRLAFAGELRRVGGASNQARAEFIETQIKIETSEYDDRIWPELARRERELLAEWGPVWERPLRGMLNPSFLRPARWLKARLFGKGGVWRYHRGFIEEIDTSAANFLEADHVLFGRTPVRRVVLSHATSYLDALVNDERLDNLYSLHLIADVEFDEEMEEIRQRASDLDLSILELRFPRIQSDTGDLLAMLRRNDDEPEEEDDSEKLEQFRNWARASERERERLREVASRPRWVQRLTEHEHFSHAEMLRLNDWIYLGDRLREAGAWAVVKTFHDLEDDDGLCRRLVLLKKQRIQSGGFEALSHSPHVYHEASV